jgi:RNA polymerase sigma-70 factor (ECF subfamily)
VSGPDAAEAFVRRLSDEHGDALFAWARRRFADRRDAEEVVAEAMVRAWRRHHQFDPTRGTERSWVFGIVRTTAADHYRRNRRHLAAVPDPEVDPGPTQSRADLVAEATLVHDALLDLSDNHREVLVLAHFEALKVDEIAHRIGVPSGTVKSRLYYGLRSLRSALEERGVLS